MSYTIWPFIIRLLAGLPMMLYLHKTFSDRKAILATAPFVEKLGVVVVYVGSQAFLFLYTISGDFVISCKPAAVIFAPYLLYRTLINVSIYLKYALGYINEKLKPKK